MLSRFFFVQIGKPCEHFRMVVVALPFDLTVLDGDTAVRAEIYGNSHRCSIQAA